MQDSIGAVLKKHYYLYGFQAYTNSYFSDSELVLRHGTAEDLPQLCLHHFQAQKSKMHSRDQACVFFTEPK